MLELLGVPAGVANSGRDAAAARSAAELGIGSGWGVRRVLVASEGGDLKGPEDCLDMLGVCLCSIDLISCMSFDLLSNATTFVGDSTACFLHLDNL